MRTVGSNPSLSAKFYFFLFRKKIPNSARADPVMARGGKRGLKFFVLFNANREFRGKYI